MKHTWTKDNHGRHACAKGLENAALGVLLCCLCIGCMHMPDIRQQIRILWAACKSVVNGQNQIFLGKQVDLGFEFCFYFSKQEACSNLKLLLLVVSTTFNEMEPWKENQNKRRNNNKKTSTSPPPPKGRKKARKKERTWRLAALHQRAIQIPSSFSSLGNRQIRKTRI